MRCQCFKTVVLCVVAASAFLTFRTTSVTAQELQDKAPVVGIFLGAPLRAALYGGVLLGDFSTPHALFGTYLAADIGLTGARVSVGRGGFGGPALGMSRMYLSLMRTWGTPLAAVGDQTYLGIDYNLGFIFASVVVGGYVRLGPRAAGDRFIAAGGIRIGS